VKISREGNSAVLSENSLEGLLRFAANTLTDQIDEAAFRRFAKLIVVIRFLAHYEPPAVVAAVEPHRAGSGQTIAAVKPDSGSHFDKRSALRQLRRCFELYAHQSCSLIILKHPHGAHRDFVTGFGLPDRTPVSGSQKEAYGNHRCEHDCSYKEGLFQTCVSRSTPFRPLLCGMGRILSIRFSDRVGTSVGNS
jgi:hypothetical protein